MPLFPALGRQRQVDLSSRLAWSTELVPGQPGLYRETLSKNQIIIIIIIITIIIIIVT